MESLTGQLLEYLTAYGPWLLFVMAVLETSFITGLAVPSGLATSLATVLAMEGALPLPVVVLAALSGGALGDSLGYWVGRLAGDRLRSGTGPLSRMLWRRTHEVGTSVGRHPVYAVTLARTVSFVRTLMPMGAGMTGISYPRFLAYELVGLVAWVGLYVAIGILAQESWARVTQLVGLGGAFVLLAAAGIVWVTFRRRWRQRRASQKSQREQP